MTPSEEHAAKVGAFLQLIADAEQRMLRIQEGLTDRFETSCRKRGYSLKRLRCDFILTVRLPEKTLAVIDRKASMGLLDVRVGAHNMMLTKIVRRYRTEFLARCDWQAEVAVILAEGWPE